MKGEKILEIRDPSKMFGKNSKASGHRFFRQQRSIDLYHHRGSSGSGSSPAALLNIWRRPPRARFSITGGHQDGKHNNAAQYCSWWVHGVQSLNLFNNMNVRTTA